MYRANSSIQLMSTEAICPSDSMVSPGQAARMTQVSEVSRGLFRIILQPAWALAAPLKHVYLPKLLHHICQPGAGILASLNNLLYHGTAHLCSGTWIAPLGSSAGAHIQRELWPGNRGFSPLGRPTHCGRKKKIIKDYISIAWLKCYQLCTGAGSFVTASRKGSKMHTLLDGGDPICKVQICIQTKVWGYFDQRREYSLLQIQKQ